MDKALMVKGRIEAVEHRFMYELCNREDPRDIPEILAQCQPLAARHFLNDDCRMTFRVVADMASKGVGESADPESIAVYGENVGLLPKGEAAGIVAGALDIRHEMDNFRLDSTPARLAGLAGMIREAARIRDARQALADAQALADSPKGETATAIIGGAIGRLSALEDEITDGNGGEPQTPEDVAMKAVKAVTGANAGGMLAGFPRLDSITGGFNPGQLILLAARPGMGKSALGMNIASSIARRYGKADKPVVVFSLEMPESEIGLRLLCSDLRIPLGDLSRRNGDAAFSAAWRKCRTEMVQTLSSLIDNGGWKMQMVFKSSMTPSEMQLECMKIARQCGGICAVLVDYVQYMKADFQGDSRNAEVAQISNALKAMAKKLECPVIALSQLNRQIDGRSGHAPVNSDLRDSGALEQDADIIMFLVREAAYAKAKGQEPTEEELEKAEVHVTKNRNGRTGVAELGFKGAECRFYDPDTEKADEMEAWRYGRAADHDE